MQRTVTIQLSWSNKEEGRCLNANRPVCTGQNEITANYLQEKQHKREHATPAVQRIHMRDLGRWMEIKSGHKTWWEKEILKMIFSGINSNQIDDVLGVLFILF